jgi:hypothetical protein
MFSWTSSFLYTIFFLKKIAILSQFNQLVLHNGSHVVLSVMCVAYHSSSLLSNLFLWEKQSLILLCDLIVCAIKFISFDNREGT